MKNLTKIFVVAFLFLVTKGFAQKTETFFNDADVFFGNCVANGKVDYEAIHKNPEKLNVLLKQAENISVSSEDAKIYQAFWINAYNLAVIKGVIDNYGIKSPMDKSGFFDKTEYKLGGTSLTLNDIENKKLRAKFNEPRFHFVLVCGAKSCPPLISEVYRPETLENQLEQQTKKSLNDPEFIKVTNGKVAVSEIFKWYKEDFVKNGQSEIDFLNKFRNDKISEGSKLGYYNYDWRLNSK